jgi:hypothetical protein
MLQGVTNGMAPANDLTAVVHGWSEAEAPAKGSQIDHSPRGCPQERMGAQVTSCIARANDLTAVVHGYSVAGAPAKGSEIDQDVLGVACRLTERKENCKKERTDP